MLHTTIIFSFRVNVINPPCMSVLNNVIHFGHFLNLPLCATQVYRFSYTLVYQLATDWPLLPSLYDAIYGQPLYERLLTMWSCSLVCFSSMMILSADSSRVQERPSLSPCKAFTRFSRSSFLSVIILI